jgi:phenylglyoxylate dehydrogenase beta subunit
MTHVVDKPLPVTTYLKSIGKYRHLSDEQLAYIQRKTDERFELLQKFTKESKLEGLSDAA